MERWLLVLRSYSLNGGERALPHNDEHEHISISGSSTSKMEAAAQKPRLATALKRAPKFKLASFDGERDPASPEITGV